MNIIETVSLWDYIFDLQNNKDIIIYGMGNGADKILDLCAVRNIKIADVFASDEFVRGQFFRGYRVKKLSEIQEIYGDDNNICVLTAFATREDDVIERIYGLNDICELYCPNFPVFGDEYPDFNFFADNIKEAEQAYNLLADDVSKEVYINMINFAISGKLAYLQNAECLKSDALDLLDLHDLRGNLHYIDVGAYTGDTIKELADYINYTRLAKITAFEPDKRNFAKLEQNLRNQNILNLCEIYNIGAWSEENILYFDAKSGRNASFNAANSKKPTEVHVNSLDNVLSLGDYENYSETLIKYDVEGAEYGALIGSKEVIKQYTPKLIVSLYHRNGDIFKLPLLIHNINPNYKFYIRKHKYIPCWDLNLYAVPKF